MKKGIKLALPLFLVMTVILTSVFTFTATAESTEASLDVKNVETRNADYGYVGYYTANSTASGTFVDMVAAATVGTESEQLLYTIKLQSDVTLETALTVNANAYTETIINLNGYTLTTKTGGNAITVSGDAGKVRIIGGNQDDGSYGNIVYQQSAGAVVSVASGSGVRVDVRNVNIDMSGVSEGGAALLAEGGELSLNGVNVNFAPASAISASFAKVNGALLEMKRVNVNGTEASGAALTAVSASGARVYLHDDVINSAFGVVTDGEKSEIISVDTAITAGSPISVASSDTTVYVLGGRIETTGDNLISGSFDASKVVFYYGSGDMKVKGESPSGYTVQDNCEFVSGTDGVWVMKNNKTGSDASVTIATFGEAPTVSYSGYKSAVTAAAAVKTSVTRVHILTLLRDATYSASSNNSFQSTEHFNYVADMNGFTLTDTQTGTYNFNVRGNVYIHYDGKGADGTSGGIIMDSKNMMFRTQAAYSVSKGYIFMLANEYTVFNFTDIGLTLTKFDEGSNPLFAIQQGEIVADGLTLSYTGTKASLSANRSFSIVSIGSSSSYGTARATVRNSVIEDVSGNEFVKMTALATVKSGNKIWADNVEFKTGGAVANAVSGATVSIKNSSVDAVSAPYVGAGTINIIDTTTAVADGVISSSAAPNFFYGTGNTYVITDAELTGSYKVEEGYALMLKEEGKFVVEDASNIINASVTMPAVFADGMVLQRNKEINVFGYCDQIGIEIEVKLNGKTAVGTVGEDGRWCATFEPMKEAFGVEMQVRAIGENVAYNLIKKSDINIGEIWVMSGQSNGDLQTVYMEDLKEYYELAGTRTNIRMYRSSQGYSVTENTIGSGTWYEATAENLANKTTAATSIGYAMAAKLSDELGPDVPIAIMHMVRGSCKIKTWLDYERIKEVSPSATREYEYWLSQNSLPSSAHGGGAVATVMYNNVIAPVYGLEIAGVLWYQGEGDTGGGYFGSTDAEFRIDGEAEDQDNCYTEFFYALEDTFREAFGNDPELPFYVMQLSPFISSSYYTENTFNLKMEQYEMCKNEPNTHLVSLGLDGAIIGGSFFAGSLDPDMGNTTISAQGFIHPTRKSTVGIRTADLILANEYGIKFSDIYTYPTPISASASADGKVTVTFDTELQYLYGDRAMGFELYNGTEWVKADGVISGNTVIISAEGVTAPASLRYGCGEMLMELRDGTLIEIIGSKGVTANYKTDATAKTLTVTYNGVEYVINGDTTDMIRSIDYGNITNASGAPLPIFSLDIVSE